MLLNRQLAALGILCGLGALGEGCDDEAPASQPAPSTAAVQESPAKPEVPVQKPMQKKVEATAEEKLGTLTDGLGLPPGSSIPDVAAQDDHGREQRLRALAQDKAMVLVFYRGGWCPFCNFQIHELVENAPAFEKRGVRLVAISVDKVEEASRTAATYTIPFPVLSDPDLVVHRAFNVVHQADAAETAKLKGFGLDIERASGKSHHAFAVPSVFIVGKDGLVRWAHVDPDYKVRPSAEQLLTVLDSLGPLP